MTVPLDFNLISVLAMHRGVSIALSGMLIVFVALVFITLFLTILPRILETLAKYFPESEEAQVSHTHPKSLVPDDEAVIAGIGFVLHTEFQKQLQSNASDPKS